MYRIVDFFISGEKIAANNKAAFSSDYSSWEAQMRYSSFLQFKPGIKMCVSWE